MATITQNQILEPQLLPLLQQQQQSQQLQLLLQLSNISYSPHISASAVILTAAVVIVVTAIIVIHKEKNNQYDEPKYSAAFTAAAVSVTE